MKPVRNICESGEKSRISVTCRREVDYTTVELLVLVNSRIRMPTAFPCSVYHTAITLLDVLHREVWEGLSQMHESRVCPRGID